jgi:hypothetical protein
MPLGKNGNWGARAAKLNFYLESAQMSLFFKETGALPAWLPPMAQGEKSRSNSLSDSGPKLAIKSVQSNPK